MKTRESGRESQNEKQGERVGRFINFFSFFSTIFWISSIFVVFKCKQREKIPEKLKTASERMRKCVFSETDSCLNDSKLFFERARKKEKKRRARLEGQDGKKKWFCFSFYAIPIIFCFVSCKAVWILTVKEKKKVEAKGFFSSARKMMIE